MTIDQLLPKEVRESLPKLGSTSEEKNPLARVKFFYPDFDWTWYGIEFDGDDIFYGLVRGVEEEFGTFRLSELMENRGTLGLEIERAFHFQPTPVRTLLD
jgi:hypothetical protein